MYISNAELLSLPERLKSIEANFIRPEFKAPEPYAEDVERLVAKLLWRDEERKNPTLYELSKREEDREKLRNELLSLLGLVAHDHRYMEFFNAIPDDLDPFERAAIRSAVCDTGWEDGCKTFTVELVDEIKAKMEESLKDRHAVLAEETLRLNTVKERIGKLERWILIHTYLKTVKGELPEGFKKVRWYEKAEQYFEKYDECYKDRDEFFEKHYDRDYNENWRGKKFDYFFDYEIRPLREHLYKSEILLNCFDLELSNKESYWGSKEIFKVSTAYKKALVSVTRALYSLVKKQYIQASYFAGATINLTERGILKVERMLNVNT